MGRTIVYEKAPETAVALSYSIAEIMVALGLKDKIVAVAPSMYSLEQVSEEYRDVVGSFPVLEGNYGVPTLETVLKTNAEFVFGDSYSFFPNSVGPAEDFEKAGVKVYATEGTCKTDSTFEEIYADILNIGKIFRVEGQANELVITFAGVKRCSGKSKVDACKLFYYDSDTGGGVAMSTIGGAGLQNWMVAQAGGKTCLKTNHLSFSDFLGTGDR